MGEVAPLQRGFDLPISKIENGKYPVVFSNGILKYNSNFKVKAPGIVTGRSGTIGNFFFIEEDFWPHNTSLWVTDFYNNKPKFIYYLYQNIKIEQLSTGSGVPTLNRNDVHKIIVRIPSLAEQTQIGNFLTAVDTRLSLLKQKYELLKSYKKGIMAQIFNQELRFKDENGQEFPAWEEKTLGEICIKKSSNVSANTITENFGTYPIYGATGLLKHIDFYKETEPYIAIIKDGAGIGRLQLCLSNSSVLSTLDIMKPNFNTNLHFLYYVLSTIDFKKYAIGSTIPHVYFSEYKQHFIKVPCLAEQTKIANFLTAIDNKINNIGEQIAQSEEWKRGLLQAMLV